MVEFSAQLALTAVLFFVVGLIVSAIIIFVVTRLFEVRRGFGTAFLAGLIGAIIYALAYFLLGHGLLAAVIGGFFWLLALKYLYNFGWVRALLVAIVVWFFALIVGYFLPTGIGPL